MKSLLVMLMAASLSTALFAQQVAAPRAASKDRKSPLMISFAELKWTELPERKGMQFALLSGDPKTGAYTQMRKSAGRH